ncbi:MAG TPA: hypothetical protein VEI52_21445 [Terriglobales bacterium]|nr:hypothetical protein [Terriglobales bacterium]
MTHPGAELDGRQPLAADISMRSFPAADHTKGSYETLILFGGGIRRNARTQSAGYYH